jgi:hypothetical protein
MNAGLRTRIVNLIKKSRNKSLSVSEIHKILIVKFPRVTKSQIKRTLIELVEIDNKRKLEGKSPNYSISPNKGGNAFRYTAGGETTRKGTGPYRDIAKVIDGDFNNITKILNVCMLSSISYPLIPKHRTQFGSDLFLEKTTTMLI